MNTPSERDWADEKAREIYDQFRRAMAYGEPFDLKSAMAQALRAARRVPEGYVREGDVDRKVLGTLPLTADGCVVGDDCTLFADGENFNAELFRSPSERRGWHPFNPFKAWSSQAAAEAAKGGGG